MVEISPANSLFFVLKGLVSSVRVKCHYYKYDIADLGLELLNRKERPLEKAKQYQSLSCI